MRKMMNMPTWYKDILWIDDMDSNDSTTADLMAEKGKTLEEINKNPEKEKKFISADENLQKYIDMIQLSTTMKDAVDEIENNYNNYNLVIFDMNMNRGWGNKEQDVEYINGIFKSQNIKSFDNNDKIAGIYLYLFLLKKGYPANRMIIYTGNAKSTGEILNDNLYLDFKGLIKDKNDRIKLASNYYPKDGYYRIRRLVLQACDYWKAEIANKKDEEIPFNQIYFSKDTDKQNSMENFQELLERIEMMFPVIPPSSPEKVYYQAARILCEYHEESAKIQVVNYNIYPLHAVCRNFRNWSSHNRLKKAEMPPNIFALIFCIALRTYFDEKQLINEFSKERFYYEKNYGYNYEDKEHKFSFDYIKNKLKDETSLLSVLDKKKKKNTISYSELVYIWGEDPSHDAEINYVLYPIIMRDYIKFTENTVDSIKLNCNSNCLFEDKKGKSYDNEFMKLVFNEACKICGYFR
jgi:hypothetical protein